MNQIVKIMVDGKSNDVNVEADSHEQAVEKLYNGFQIKNNAGKMMSEEIIIFDEFGVDARKIKNILCE